MRIFRPEDFGALADGIHNDAIALWEAIAAAIERGEIAKERHESYLSIYADLVGKRPWKKK